MYYKQNLVLLCLIKLQLIEELIVLANNHGILIKIEKGEIVPDWVNLGKWLD